MISVEVNFKTIKVDLTQGTIISSFEIIYLCEYNSSTINHFINNTFQNIPKHYRG